MNEITKLGYLVLDKGNAVIDLHTKETVLTVDAEGNYVTGVEEWDWTATPYAAFTTSAGIGLSVETEINMRELDEDIFQGIDWTAEYAVSGVTIYTEVSSDSDWEFGDITVGAKVKF